SGSVYYPFTTKVIVIVVIKQGYLNNSTRVLANVRIDGQIMGTFGAGLANDSPVIMCSATLGAGTHTFSVEWYGINNQVLFNKADMAVWGAMR
ncbi:MAG: hypothetical protein WAU54_12550, partial [Chania sp.]